MKYLLLLAIFPFLMSSECKKEKESLPACIQAKIDEIKAMPRWNPPATVDEYQYKGQRVFLFSSNCCDQFNYVYSETCTVVCAPSGGITGRGDGNCSDFTANAKHVKLVWKDPR